MYDDIFDYIVTGAGSAGCAVAARLSESGDSRVLLLEAGQRDSNPWIHIPIGYHKLYTHDELNWKFESEPVAGLNGRTSYQPRGKMLGGTSSLNGMIYMRGTAADYDDSLDASAGTGQMCCRISVKPRTRNAARVNFMESAVR